MRILKTTATVTAGLALMAAPALAGKPTTTPNNDSNPGAQHRAQPGPKASLPQKAKAYGKYCQNESKKRSDAKPGTKGTPFSQCVTAMAKLAHGDTKSPRHACKDLSHRRSDAKEGTKGTPFSQCVTGANKLLRDQRKGGSTS